ncbi:MAG: ParA family protein [Spirochaetaceae bacterium]
MARVIVFANQKGGVGKTTTAANLGAYLADAGKRVLLIDFDPQGNLSSSVGARTDGSGVYELITKQSTFDEVVQDTVVPNLRIVPSTPDLAGAAVELVDEPRREFFLKEAVKRVAPAADYVFIDSPPSLGLLTLNGLVAADQVYIPLQCEYFALEGLTQLLKSVRTVQAALNPTLEVGGIIFTMFDSRTKLANEVVEEVVSHFGRTVFRTIIPRNVRLGEAPSYSVPISRYDPNSTGAKSYAELAQEVLNRG